MDYLYKEMADMHLMYGLFQGNGLKGGRFYHEQFPSHGFPSHPTFARGWKIVGNRLIHPLQFEYMPQIHPQTVSKPEKEEYALDSYRDTSFRSTRVMEAILSVSPAAVWRVLLQEGLEPFCL